MRACAGKLVRLGPSGTAKRNTTEKEMWIIANFGFLVDHITEIPSRQGNTALQKKIGKARETLRNLEEEEGSSTPAEDSGPQEISDPDISMDVPPVRQTKGRSLDKSSV